MESDSKPPSAFNPSHSTFADFFGAVIALLTLAIPLVLIVHYSPTQVSAFPSAPYSVPPLNRNTP